MRHIFVDTNLLIDFLYDRKPFSENAAKLFAIAEKKMVKLYVASISFNNVYYIIRRTSSHSKAIDLLRELEQMVEILSIDEKTIKRAIASDFNDFEDAIQNFCAKSHSDIEIIATRNEKDFKKSKLAVLGPDAVLGLLSDLQ